MLVINEHFNCWFERRNMFEKTLIFVLGLTLVASRRDPFYRKDYTYVDEYDAFYKVHWDGNGLSWGLAFLTCDDEESSLFYPKVKDEWMVVKTLVGAMKEKPNVTDIIVGMHDEFGLGEFITVDGLPTPSPVATVEQVPGTKTCVTMDIDTGSYKIGNCDMDTVKPFVCKKKVVVEGCPTVDSGYTYVKELKKCYKVNQRKRTWDSAMKTCFLEGGILAVIADSTEAEVVKRKLANFEDYFVGFRRLFPDNDLYTVKGQNFDDKFYSNWANNDNDDIHRDCGAVFAGNNGYDNSLHTKTKSCYDLSPFVCEMTPMS